MDMDPPPPCEAKDTLPHLSLAIPFFNEEPNVEPVLEGLLAVLDGAGLRFEIRAVDNGSWDGTGDRVEEMRRRDRRVVPVTVPNNRGYGFGILTGLREARGAVVGYAWGDNQVSAADLLRIYQALISEKAGCAKACRVKRYDGLFRLAQTRCYSLLFALLFGRGFRDPNGCPKLFLRSAYERLAPRSHDWLLDPELVIKARRLGLKVVDVPVVFQKRRHGKSKVSRLTGLGFFLGLLKMRLRSPS